MKKLMQTSALTGLALAGVIGFAAVAEAGGFAVREQSTTSQGMSFANSASSDTLSSMYWNPAAVANQDGMNSESHFSVIIPDSEITNSRCFVKGLGFVPCGAPTINPGNTGSSSGEIGKSALVSSSYANMQLGSDLFLGLSLNAPFGLTTEPDNRNWAGSIFSRTSKVFNIVGTPTVGYKVAPGVTLGAGVQVGYLDGTFKFGRALGPNFFYNGDDYGVGWTLGAMFEPAHGTKIGIGYRSEIQYDLEGTFGDNNTGRRFGADVELTTPDIFTVSITQALAPSFRVSATYEWTDWSDFRQLDIVANQSGVVTALAAGGGGTLPTKGISVAGQTFASLPANWEDGWMVALGAEFDASPDLTLRAGVSYEESPIQKAENRLTAVPDNNRIWLSAGLSYHVGQVLPSLFGGGSDSTIDLAYTHIIIEDGDIQRESISNSNLVLFAESDDANVDIISFALRTKFGGPEPVMGSFK